MLATTLAEESPTTATSPSQTRRFLRALATTNLALVLPAFWLTFVDWRDHVTLFPRNPQGDVYDLQARAMLSGHLNVPARSLGIEGFIHDGKTYTYFGLFPSLMRLPILMITHSLDGRLTAMSLFVAWLAICVATGACLLLIRHIIRGAATASRLEVLTVCAMSATLTAGTVIPSLLACPRVYEEDIAWSIALGLGLLAFVLAFFLQPRRRWFIGIVVLTLAAVMTRGSTGDAWFLVLLGLAGFCRFSSHGQTWRRFTWWFAGLLLASGLLTVAVSYLKFGIIYGFDERDQVWTHVDAHRRAFLAANADKTFGLQFVPTTVKAYFSPVGMWVSGLFPFFQTPKGAVSPVGHVTFDQIWPTRSLTASTPFFLGLSIFGTVVATVKAATPLERVLRIAVLGTVAATVPVLIFGYIAPRYLGDFVPWMVFASATGFFWTMNRLKQRAQLFMNATTGFAILGVVMNSAAALTMQASWSTVQVSNFTSAQHELTPQALANEAVVRSSVPIQAPPGQIVIVGNCKGIYRTLGPQPNITLSLMEHVSWFSVAPTPGAEATLSIAIKKTPTFYDQELVLATRGLTRLVLRPFHNGAGRLIIEYPVSQIPPVPTVSHPFVLTKGQEGIVKVAIDPYLHTTDISGFDNVFKTSFAGPGVTKYPPVVSKWATVTTSQPWTKSPLCQQILKEKG
jgi:hypothetical protein